MFSMPKRPLVIAETKSKVVSRSPRVAVYVLHTQCSQSRSSALSHGAARTVSGMACSPYTVLA